MPPKHSPLKKYMLHLIHIAAIATRTCHAFASDAKHSKRAVHQPHPSSNTRMHHPKRKGHHFNDFHQVFQQQELLENVKPSFHTASITQQLQQSQQSTIGTREWPKPPSQPSTSKEATTLILAIHLILFTSVPSAYASSLGESPAFQLLPREPARYSQYSQMSPLSQFSSPLFSPTSPTSPMSPMSTARKQLKQLQELQDSRLDACVERGIFWEQCFMFGESEGGVGSSASISTAARGAGNSMSSSSSGGSNGAVGVMGVNGVIDGRENALDYQLISPVGALNPPVDKQKIPTW